MYYYFCANLPSVIKIDGNYLGRIDKDFYCYQGELNRFPFVEICSISSLSQNACFMLDQQFLSCPPPFVSVTDLVGGYLIKINDAPITHDFNVLCQEKFNNVIATVFYDGTLKISIETPNDFFVHNLPLNPNSAIIKSAGFDGFNFVLVELCDFKNTLEKHNEKYISIYCIDDKIKQVFFDSVFSYDFTPNLVTEKTYLDIAKHKLNCRWKYDGKNFTIAEKVVTRSSNFNLDTLNENIIPYAFLEELLVGDDVSPFLAEEVNKNASKLTSYFGCFIGIMPPPKFRDSTQIGLIYPKGENTYQVKYFTFEIKNRKICNIVKV